MIKGNIKKIIELVYGYQVCGVSNIKVVDASIFFTYADKEYETDLDSLLDSVNNIENLAEEEFYKMREAALSKT